MRARKIIEVEPIFGALSGILGATYMTINHSADILGWIAYFLLIGSIGAMVSNTITQSDRRLDDMKSHTE